MEPLKPEVVPITAVLTFAGEDALMYLPVGESKKYKKGQMIYGPESKDRLVYLITSGQVALGSMDDEGFISYNHLRLEDDLLGYEAYVGKPYRTSAWCLTEVMVMQWSIATIASRAYSVPKLGPALLTAQVDLQMESDLRMAMEARMKISERLAAMLSMFASRLGEPQEDGSLLLPAFTHETLSRFVWTSREISTHYMNIFRRLGWIRYSRKGIIIIHGGWLVEHSLGKRGLST